MSARVSLFVFLFVAAAAGGQDLPVADPAQLAFEEGRWEDAIREFREILDAYPEDRLSWLRIAQAERELGRYESALGSLEQALANSAPEAMVYVERARDLLGLGRTDEAIRELETADHLELRARVLLEEEPDFDVIRDDPRFTKILASVRSRVLPCEGMAEASQFDFWLGRWEVRGPDGTLLGHSTMMLAWWTWFFRGYPGVHETVALLLG